MSINLKKKNYFQNQRTKLSESFVEILEFMNHKIDLQII